MLWIWCIRGISGKNLIRYCGHAQVSDDVGNLQPGTGGCWNIWCWRLFLVPIVLYCKGFHVNTNLKNKKQKIDVSHANNPDRWANMYVFLRSRSKINITILKFEECALHDPMLFRRCLSPQIMAGFGWVVRTWPSLWVRCPKQHFAKFRRKKEYLVTFPRP